MEAGEVCVGQELGLLVEGERGLLVLQVGSWDTRVGVSHAAPDWAAGVGTPHAAASWLIHGDAIYDKSFPSRGVEPPLSLRKLGGKSTSAADDPTQEHSLLTPPKRVRIDAFLCQCFPLSLSLSLGVCVTSFALVLTHSHTHFPRLICNCMTPLLGLAVFTTPLKAFLTSEPSSFFKKHIGGKEWQVYGA